MDNILCQKLREIVAEYGLDVSRDPKRCKALLLDYGDGRRREIFALVAAVEERVPEHLLAAQHDEPVPGLTLRLAYKIAEPRSMELNAAQWAVEAWAFALDIASAASPAAPPMPPATPVQSATVSTPKTTDAPRDIPLPKVIRAQRNVSAPKIVNVPHSLPLPNTSSIRVTPAVSIAPPAPPRLRWLETMLRGILLRLLLLVLALIVGLGIGFLLIGAAIIVGISATAPLPSPTAPTAFSIPIETTTNSLAISPENADCVTAPAHCYKLTHHVHLSTFNLKLETFSGDEL